jgi:hypothetical protein
VNVNRIQRKFNRALKKIRKSEPQTEEKKTEATSSTKKPSIVKRIFAEIKRRWIGDVEDSVNFRLSKMLLNLTAGSIVMAFALKHMTSYLEAMAAFLPFGPIISSLIVGLFVELPALVLIGETTCKITSMIISPELSSLYSPISRVGETPRMMMSMINFMIAGTSTFVAGAATLLINVNNKLVWLFETFWHLPADLYYTHSIDGFLSDMKAWFFSWKPSLFLESSLGAVMAKQFHLEEERKQRQEAQESKENSAPKPSEEARKRVQPQDHLKPNYRVKPAT